MVAAGNAQQGVERACREAGLDAFLPTGRAIRPITWTHWEYVGVKPDITGPAEQALQAACADALMKRVAEAKAERERARLGALLARVEEGEYGRGT